jgi:Protein of unknown function (DUF1592)/Protein of unknown function (DUF1588)/Protein of unknown function (DUF1585)/Protein of unknown function (DUF1595)/Protein of unknown function (DUF1587)
VAKFLLDRIFFCILGAGVVLSNIGQARAAQSSRSAVKSIDRSLLDKYCVTCHNDKLKTGGLALDKVDLNDVRGNAEVLEKVVRKLRTQQMPPDGLPRPDKATLDGFAGTLEAALDQVAKIHRDPGRVVAHRLNRAEYVNVIHDLLALDIDGAELLPNDMAGYGFDNNAEVLSVTPGLLARYMSAATKISRVAMGSPDNRPITRLYTVPLGSKQDDRMGEGQPFATHGGLAVRHTFPLDGEYVFRMRLRRNDDTGALDGIDTDVSQIELRVDRGLVKRFRIGGEFKGPDPGNLIAVREDDIEGAKVHNYRFFADKALEIRIPVKAGTRLVAAGFADSAPLPLDRETIQAPVRAFGNTTIGMESLEILGPFDGKTPEDTPSRRQILTCRPASTREEDLCARKIIATLARRAFRRPALAAEIDPLISIYQEGRKARDFDTGIERALEALLSSPDFLIRVEQVKADTKAETAYRLSDLELASRLSFFLWKSIPDDELLEVAERGKLKDPAVLASQVRRMLSDRRATRFMDDFTGQWLQVRNISSQDPDRALFPDFDSTLRDAMATETELFLRSQIQEDHPIPELLSANYTFLNERLARHYGINDVHGSHFRRVILSDDRRFGLLGQASILTVSSYANRTSVVLRGKWILENILGTPPPPPPPNVPPLKENDGKGKPTSLRERMEAHRKSAVCASCHSRMDPLGFALEHYDAIGKWRENDQGAEINSTIDWSDRTIDNPKAFREALLTRSDQFVQTVTEKLMTYALGRGVDYMDAPTIRQIDSEVARGDRWSTLILGVVNSAPFQMRRAPLQPGTVVALSR